MTDSYDLGDFIETLPYEGGPESPDEFIANSLLIKKLETRNKELKQKFIEGDLFAGREYIPSTDRRFYIGVSKRGNYEYGPAVLELEKKLKTMEKKLSELRERERDLGTAVETAPTVALTVRPMTKTSLDKIQVQEERLAGGEDDL